MTKTELICINCPLGCQMSAYTESGVFLKAEGNNCPKGEKYARQEVISPMRTVTSTVRLIGGTKERISVKTLPEVPKNMIFSVMEVIHSLSVVSPVKIGDVLVKDIAGTTASLIATSEG